MTMGQLHEVLAVEQDAKSVATKVLDEGRKTFKDRDQHFMGQIRHYEPVVEGPGHTAMDDQHKEVATTVHAKLGYILQHVARFLDCRATVDATNQQARADIILDGKELAKDIPGITLLGLEQEIKRIRDVLGVMPTLPPGHKWEADAQQGDHIYRMANPVKKERTTKKLVPQVLYEATDHHPAQVQTIDDVQVVGYYTTEVWSSAISPAQKSEIMGRCDKLLRAVKQARMRANQAEVIQTKLGKTLTNFILNG
jgi:hypothetical protein